MVQRLNADRQSGVPHFGTHGPRDGHGARLRLRAEPVYCDEGPPIGAVATQPSAEVAFANPATGTFAAPRKQQIGMRRASQIRVVKKLVAKVPEVSAIAASPASIEQVVRGPYDSKELVALRDLYLFFSKDHMSRTEHLSLRGTRIGGHVLVAKVSAGLFQDMDDSEIGSAIAQLNEFAHGNVEASPADDAFTPKLNRTRGEELADDRHHLSWLDNNNRSFLIVALAEIERHLFRRFRATLKEPTALDSTRLQFNQVLALARSQNLVSRNLTHVLMEFEKLRNRLAHEASGNIEAREIHLIRKMLPEDEANLDDLDYWTGMVGYDTQDLGIDLSADDRSLRSILSLIEAELGSDLRNED